MFPTLHKKGQNPGTGIEFCLYSLNSCVAPVSADRELSFPFSGGSSAMISFLYNIYSVFQRCVIKKSKKYQRRMKLNSS